MPIEKGPVRGAPEEEKAHEVEVIEGRLSFDNVDDANVPVDIWLGEEKDAGGNKTKTGFYTLDAGDYMPRKGRVIEASFGMRSKDPEALRRIVREKIIPIYQTALVELEAIANGESDHLYYWKEERSEKTSSKV